MLILNVSLAAIGRVALR